MAAPNLQIQRGPGHPDPEIRASKKFFSAPRASVWSKHKGGGEGGPPGPLPWIRHWRRFQIYPSPLLHHRYHRWFALWFWLLCLGFVVVVVVVSCLRDGVVGLLLNPPALAGLSKGWVQRPKRSFITQECASICTSNLLFVHDTADKKVEKH